ncbi:MAG: beta-galactosidase [Firmicutes bacterium]|nr:beta-galactosidase [Bacillota bacterium]
MEKLLFGAAYYDEYMPESRIDEDFRLMREAGMNVIRIAESTWSTWEPRDGEFCFDSLHRMLDGASRWGLSVIVGTPTYAIPPWLYRKCPEILPVTHAGQNLYGARQNMDITHPLYRFHAERILRRLLAEVQPYRCVIGFQLDNETKAYDTCSPGAQAAFKTYLKEKFGTVEAMNAAFGFAYWSNSVHDWDDLPDVRGTINGSYAAEYAAFQRTLVTEFLMWQRAIVEEYRRPEQFVTHNFDFDWEPWHCAGLQPEVDQFRAQAALTIAGSDIYYPTADELTGEEISFGCALTRALKKDNFLVLETQAQGPLRNDPYPGQVRLAAFSLVAGGANMVEYWHWHSIHNAIESYWRGVLGHDLRPGRMYAEIASVGRDFARLGGTLCNFRPRSRVAILVSNRSLTGLRNDASFSGFSYNRDALMPLHRALFRSNVAVDLLGEDARDFSAYALVAVPALYCAPEGLIAALKSYVNQGGKLLATCRSFYADENAQIRHAAQPYGMTEVFGMHYEQLTPAREAHVGHYQELLEPHEGTEVLRRYTNPSYAAYACATMHRYGRGQAAYIGADFDDELSIELVAELLRRMGLSLPAERWPLVLKDGEGICYAFNYSASPRAYSPPRECTDLLTGERFAPGESAPLPGWGVRIFQKAQQEAWL